MSGLHTEDREFSGGHDQRPRSRHQLRRLCPAGSGLLRQELHFDAGLRFDYFRFDVDDRPGPARLADFRALRDFSPRSIFPTLPPTDCRSPSHASYGRGISSQDARGVVQRPGRRRRFRLQTSISLALRTPLKRFSLSTDVFLIDRSNEQVYIPDDGSFEFKGPSRSYGWEAKTSVQLTHNLVLNGGFTQVSNAFFPATLPRIYVDSAPHSVANSGLTLSDWHGFNGSLRYRHISGYILDGRCRSTACTRT